MLVHFFHLGNLVLWNTLTTLVRALGSIPRGYVVMLPVARSATGDPPFIMYKQKYDERGRNLAEIARLGPTIPDHLRASVEVIRLYILLVLILDCWEATLLL